MKISFTQFSLVAALLISFPTLAQYGGYGYGNGYGYGRGGLGGFSQTPQTPRKPPTVDQIADDQTKWMIKKLKLNEEQSLSVEMLNIDHAFKLNDYQEAYMKTYATTRPTQQEIETIRTTAAKWNTEKEAKLQAILTPEQWDIYQKKKKSMPYSPQ